VTHHATTRLSLLAWSLAACVAVGSASASTALAALEAQNVLVVYNSQSAVDTDGNAVADSLDIFNAYQAYYPDVVGFDLNDASIDGAMSNGTIDQDEYRNLIRNPIRSFLSGSSLEQQVSVVTMTKGLPHRISDDDQPTVGDASTASEFNDLDATYASVESELTLLWQNLRGTGNLATDTLIKVDTGSSVAVSNEDGTDRAYDSAADNGIVNPYFQSAASITEFDRTDVTAQRLFELQTSGGDSGFQLMQNVTITGPSVTINGNSDAGAILLTARLDGQHVDDVIGAIGRAQNIAYNELTDRVLIMEDPPGTLDGSDFDNAAANLVGLYDNVSFETDGTFFVGATAVPSVTSGEATPITDPVAAHISYGGNHNGNGTSLNGYLQTFDGQLVNGAIFSALESYNARPLNGGSEFNDQANVEEWFAAGGTFAVGNVWEPFASTPPRNSVLFPTWFSGELTWVESAWSATPYLSWQQTVLGGPLARATFVIPEPAAGLLLGAGVLATFRRMRR